MLSFHLFILCNVLVMLSFPSFPLIFFFLQVFWSKFATLLKFSRIKPIKTNHFWITPSTIFLSPVSFFSFLELSFLHFRFRLSFFSICFGSTFTFFKSRQEVAYFQRSTHLPRPAPLISSLVLGKNLFMRLLKWSRRLHTVTRNSSQLLEINGYKTLDTAPSFQQKNVLSIAQVFRNIHFFPHAN